jgi:hypothetical protein
MIPSLLQYITNSLITFEKTQRGYREPKGEAVTHIILPLPTKSDEGPRPRV